MNHLLGPPGAEDMECIVLERIPKTTLQKQFRDKQRNMHAEFRAEIQRAYYNRNS